MIHWKKKKKILAVKGPDQSIKPIEKSIKSIAESVKKELYIWEKVVRSSWDRMRSSYWKQVLNQLQLEMEIKV